MVPKHPVDSGFQWALASPLPPVDTHVLSGAHPVLKCLVVLEDDRCRSGLLTNHSVIDHCELATLCFEIEEIVIV